jgi:hypothetical protein
VANRHSLSCPIGWLTGSRSLLIAGWGTAAAGEPPAEDGRSRHHDSVPEDLAAPPRAPCCSTLAPWSGRSVRAASGRRVTSRLSCDG